MSNAIRRTDEQTEVAEAIDRFGLEVSALRFAVDELERALLARLARKHRTA